MSRIDDLLAELTTEEKCSLTAGDNVWQTRAIERLGIGRLKVTDGPNGARGDSESGATAACFPVGSALAATFDVELVGRVGAALADEARSKGGHVLLAPTVNLHRTPLGGRNFECYSEDPYLTGQVAVAYITGLQERGVGACIKHFVANDSEFERHTISSEIDERTLRELYLRPFEMAVHQADPWSVMASYNRIDNVYACAHHRLLTEVLRDEWGWDGVVISDWGAVQEAAATVAAGMDLEMPGPGMWLGPKLADAVDSGEVSATDLDRNVRRILRLLERAGRLDDTNEPDERADDSPDLRALTREAAAASMVLLKNDAEVLPLRADTLTSLAVIGPNARDGRYQGGGSSQVFAHHVTHPLSSIEAAVGDQCEIRYEPGCLTHRFVPELDSILLSPVDGDAVATPERPVRLSYFESPDFEGEPIRERPIRQMLTQALFAEVPGLPDNTRFGARYESVFTSDTSGTHTFSLCAAGKARLLVDGEIIVDNWTDPQRGDWMYGFTSKEVVGTVVLTAGTAHRLVVEYGRSTSWGAFALRVGHLPPVPVDLLDLAVDAAAYADAAIVVVGTNGDWESEGYDRTAMELPGDQAELIRRVAAVQPNSVVVLNCGSPVTTADWIDAVPAALVSWFPGQGFGDGLVDVLFGAVDPGGRLPSTWPIRVEDSPSWLTYPGDLGQVRYGEGIFMGYRGYDRLATEVSFPFGHGLSYGSTTWTAPEATADLSGSTPTATVRLTVANDSEREVSDVVQAYVGPVPHRTSPVSRAPRVLAGFVRIRLQPGETRQVELALDPRSFQYYDPRESAWRTFPGVHVIELSRSSRDCVLSLTLDDT